RFGPYYSCNSDYGSEHANVENHRFSYLIHDRLIHRKFYLARIDFFVPALAGVLKELEGESFVQNYFARRTPQESRRVKQALGVLVRLHMEARGWRTTGRKGALGRRDPSYAGCGEHNTVRSFSKFILSAERYRR
ncbi:MAG: hypothetical protein R6X16_00620, partial [Anaerolineae bacterium]